MKTTKTSAAKAAALLARQGDWRKSLTALSALSNAGDGVAAASTAELLAALGRWADFVPHAARFLANPAVVKVGNVFTDLTRLVRRASRELGDESIITTIAAKIPEGRWHSMRDATLLKELVLPSAQPGPENRAAFEDAVKSAQTAKRFKDKPPRELEEHCFALACAFKVEGEVISRYDPAWRSYGKAQDVARVLARRGDEGHAWGILEPMIPYWPAMDHAQVFPVELLVDPWLQKLMTKERSEQVLSTPRSEFA
jgi:hypothetical protein